MSSGHQYVNRSLKNYNFSAYSRKCIIYINVSLYFKFILVEIRQLLNILHVRILLIIMLSTDRPTLLQLCEIVIKWKQFNGI